MIFKTTCKEVKRQDTECEKVSRCLYLIKVSCDSYNLMIIKINNLTKNYPKDFPFKIDVSTNVNYIEGD